MSDFPPAPTRTIANIADFIFVRANLMTPPLLTVPPNAPRPFGGGDNGKLTRREPARSAAHNARAE